MGSIILTNAANTAIPYRSGPSFTNAVPNKIKKPNNTSSAVPAYSPRKVTNLIDRDKRYPTASPLGTGVVTQGVITSAAGVTTGTLKLESGSAGRAYWSQTLTLTANTWYALSFDVIDITMASGNLLNNPSGTATIDRGGPITITAAQATAGGPGRYGVTFCSTAGGTIIPRLGVGLSANSAGMSVTIKNLQLEVIDATLGAYPSEYVYPGYSAVFNSLNPNTLDSNGKVITSATRNYFPVKPFSSILAIGDSRMDEIGNIASALDTLLGANGMVNIYAHAGWTTTNAVGPTTLHSVDLTFDKALSGELLQRTLSTAGAEELSDYIAEGYYPFDTLMICDFGVNNITGGPGATETDNADIAYNEIIGFANKAKALGMNIIMGSNNPFKAHASYTAAKLTALKYLDEKLRIWCKDNGGLYVYTYDALGDSTDRDKLSDGGGTTTDYSDDALHLNDAGSTLYATLIKAAIDKFK
jgi:lysophospholipase L1-like esterase